MRRLECSAYVLVIRCVDIRLDSRCLTTAFRSYNDFWGSSKYSRAKEPSEKRVATSKHSNGSSISRLSAQSKIRARVSSASAVSSRKRAALCVSFQTVCLPDGSGSVTDRHREGTKDAERCCPSYDGVRTSSRRPTCQSSCRVTMGRTKRRFCCREASEFGEPSSGLASVGSAWAGRRKPLSAPAIDQGIALRPCGGDVE